MTLPAVSPRHRRVRRRQRPQRAGRHVRMVGRPHPRPGAPRRRSTRARGAVVIPNFSLGSALGTAFATVAARFFDSIEIIETHGAGKVDSPSGTAVRTAELIGAAARRTRTGGGAAHRPARPRPAGRERADPQPPDARRRRPAAGDLRRRGGDAHHPPRHDRFGGVRGGHPARPARRGDGDGRDGRARQADRPRHRRAGRRAAPRPTRSRDRP